MVLLKRYRMPTSINAMEGDAKSACVSQIVANTFGPPVIGFKTVEGAPIHSGRSYPQTKWRPLSLEKITKSAVKTGRKMRATAQRKSISLCGIGWTRCRYLAEISN